MSTQTENGTFTAVKTILFKMVQDNGYDEEISPETYLVGDLGFESIDVVVLGATIQQHYQTVFPFAEFLTMIGQRENRDILVGELVAFIEKHLD